jgi:hypothetical protein
MPNIPFAVYDFFGYLASGFLLIVATAFIGLKDLSYDPKFLVAILIIIVAYIIGHLIAIPGKLLLESWIVRRILRGPEENLFNLPPNKKWARIFPGFYKPFPKKIIKRIINKDTKINEPGEDLSTLAYAKTKADEKAISRSDIFLCLYGFCRNTSLTMIIIGVMLTLKGWHRGTILNLSLIILSIIFSVGLFYRYLKFIRQYWHEIFLSFMESGEAKK